MAITSKISISWALLWLLTGTLNTPKIKGTHTAMKSGMIAAEDQLSLQLNLEGKKDVLDCYNKNFEFMGRRRVKKSEKRKTFI